MISHCEEHTDGFCKMAFSLTEAPAGGIGDGGNYLAQFWQSGKLTWSDPCFPAQRS